MCDEETSISKPILNYSPSGIDGQYFKETENSSEEYRSRTENSSEEYRSIDEEIK